MAVMKSTLELKVLESTLSLAVLESYLDTTASKLVTYTMYIVHRLYI